MTTIPDPKIYRDAADVLRTNGWHQGSYYASGSGLPPEHCQVCLLGALRVATTGQPEGYSSKIYATVAWLEGFLNTGVPRSLHMFLDSWNDDPGRTVADVIDLLTRAAAAAEAARAAEGGVSRG